LTSLVDEILARQTLVDEKMEEPLFSQLVAHPEYVDDDEPFLERNTLGGDKMLSEISFNTLTQHAVRKQDSSS
jgi:hypothetical protein